MTKLQFIISSQRIIINLEEKLMSRLETPFRYDHVGSFLRPEKLKEARRKFDEGVSEVEKDGEGGEK